MTLVGGQVGCHPARSRLPRHEHSLAPQPPKHLIDRCSYPEQALRVSRRATRRPAPPQGQHSTPYTLHPTPYTLHPTSYTLHPTPHTLHPPPINIHLPPTTLHLTPYTLHPTPYTAVEGLPLGTYRCRANMAHVRQSRPDHAPDFQVKVLWEGYREHRKCSRDTCTESYVTKYTSTRR